MRIRIQRFLSYDDIFCSIPSVSDRLLRFVDSFRAVTRIPEDTMLYADRTLISQVFVNLLKNATEALNDFEGERKITIHSTIDAEERIQIEFTNNGSAIPAEVADNIFTPFFTTKTDGSGIGLAVSRQIIRLHGGTLRLKHNDKGRVTFAIVLE